MTCCGECCCLLLLFIVVSVVVVYHSVAHLVTRLLSHLFTRLLSHLFTLLLSSLHSLPLTSSHLPCIPFTPHALHPLPTLTSLIFLSPHILPTLTSPFHPHTLPHSPLHCRLGRNGNSAVGVEFSEQAVQEFFADHKLQYTSEQVGPLMRYKVRHFIPVICIQ